VLPATGGCRALPENGKGIVSWPHRNFFQKIPRLLSPRRLWLNHLSRIFGFKQVPIKEISKVLTELPVLKQITRFLSNHNVGDLNFLDFTGKSQRRQIFCRALFEGGHGIHTTGARVSMPQGDLQREGFKRMDGSGLNYSDWLPWFPEHIPVFHFWGTRDNLVPLENLRYRKALSPPDQKNLSHQLSPGFETHHHNFREEPAHRFCGGRRQSPGFALRQGGK
jgi:hypothetical protein